MEGDVFCALCKRKISSVSNLKKHIKTIHPDHTEYIESVQKTQSKTFPFSCKHCLKQFTHSRNFNFHIKTHKNYKVNEKVRIITQFKQKCAMCNNYNYDKKGILDHYSQTHDIEIKENKICFDSNEEFLKWKDNFETASNSKFILEYSKSYKNHTYSGFRCHRSGKYIPAGNGLRHLKTQGSNKINAFCPASIKLKNANDGKCNVIVIETHVGHQNEIGHLNLTATERENLAVKIASKIPFDDILDDVRDSICDFDLKRLHLLTKKDLHNIESCYNLCSSSVRHSNDVVSVESWINEMRIKGDAILFYKPQGSVVEEWPALKQDDFALMIMTTAQCEMLKKYGSDCVCIDGTHGLNSYDFELITLLVVDDIRQGFPCAFLISNRSDEDILSIFFYYVKSKLGTEVCPTVFMSDMAESFFNAWLQVMSPPKLRLFCAWHVDRAWRKNLTKIKTKEKQIFVYKQLRTVLEERDITSFYIIINNFYTALLKDPETLDFAKYFKGEYMANTAYWAYCHRLGAGINTNMHLERMHKTLKYTYLKGKHVKRLDKGINAIMRLVRDKCIDRLIILNKGKLCKKIQLIRTRHEGSKNLNANLVIQCENGWNVASEKMTDLYFIQKVTENCDCKLICSDCKVCIHIFSCSCLDSSIKYNMCKHIHLLCTFLNDRITTTDLSPEVVTAEVDMDDSNLEIIVDPHIDETRAILTELSSTSIVTSDSLEEKKAKLTKTVVELIKSAKSHPELDVIQKCLAPIHYTLLAIEGSKSVIPQRKTKIPHNKKIQTQRRLVSTKKKRENKKNPYKRPESAESQNIAISLLTSLP